MQAWGTSAPGEITGTDFDAELAKLLDAEGSGPGGLSGSTGPAGDGPTQGDGDDSPQDGPAKG